MDQPTPPPAEPANPQPQAAPEKTGWREGKKHKLPPMKKDSRKKPRTGYLPEIPLPTITPNPEVFTYAGLRCVEPYYVSLSTMAKRRWVGKTVLSIFEEEFPVYRQYQGPCIDGGRIRVNDRRVERSFVINDGDQVSHIFHHHEPCVFDMPIEIISNTPELVVVSKPPSIPVHPCGRYHFNTLFSRLEKEFGFVGLHALNRLDQAVSGVVLLGRNKQSSGKILEDLRTGAVRKHYIARVWGAFPESVCGWGGQGAAQGRPILAAHAPSWHRTIPTLADAFRSCVCPPARRTLTVDAALTWSAPHLRTVRVAKPDEDAGKASVTRFTRICASRDGTQSLIFSTSLAPWGDAGEPISGRTHQLRVHLAHAGFPIVGDLVYGPNRPRVAFPKFFMGKPGSYQGARHPPPCLLHPYLPAPPAAAQETSPAPSPSPSAPAPSPALSAACEEEDADADAGRQGDGLARVPHSDVIRIPAHPYLSDPYYCFECRGAVYMPPCQEAESPLAATATPTATSAATSPAAVPGVPPAEAASPQPVPATGASASLSSTCAAPTPAVASSPQPRPGESHPRIQSDIYEVNDMAICLHSLCYQGPGFLFQSQAPDWALEILDGRPLPPIPASAVDSAPPTPPPS
ncbi:putative RNA pseudouridine synthase 7 [Paratrimastix pyriformis]|uniref:RNA pseudouridine synthase 7 n=1 Tax=Paratrimastix pyriformis TaxID=342808 RepID=A0ABQ8UN11_9EUKA|nr:putative RNA pseudouridine synthase 7 [Paratrimastix pyriformis]